VERISSECPDEPVPVTRYLLDTNVISELRRTKPHGAVVAWVETLRPEQIFLSAVTIGELQAGVELTRKSDAAKALEIENWLSLVVESFSVIPMDAACFREWARLKAGKTSDLIEDAMIAATARIHGLHLATRNGRDFEQFHVVAFNPFQFKA